MQDLGGGNIKVFPTTVTELKSNDGNAGHGYQKLHLASFFFFFSIPSQLHLLAQTNLPRLSYSPHTGWQPLYFFFHSSACQTGSRFASAGGRAGIRPPRLMPPHLSFQSRCFVSVTPSQPHALPRSLLQSHPKFLALLTPPVRLSKIIVSCLLVFVLILSAFTSFIFFTPCAMSSCRSN